MKYFSIISIKKLPVICNIPHSSTVIPKKFSQDFLLSKKDLNNEVKLMADLYTDKIYKSLFENFGGIISKVSRIVVDIERFSDDKKEPMSKVGMGILYIKTSNGTILRKINPSRRKEYIEEIYKPYHESLNDVVVKSLKENEMCLIIDCHSFPSKDRMYESDKKLNRPDVCIGIDDFHTPRKLKMLLKKKFEEGGYSVKYNSPFSGTLVPSNFYHKNKNVHSVMIEINRKLYMNEETFSLNENWKEVSSSIVNVINQSVFELYGKNK